MSINEFKESLKNTQPPSELSLPLQALWHDARGDWDKAHDLINDLMEPDAAYVHAYLHRKEGDLGNAAYWYRNAGKPVAHDGLDEEWERLLAYLI